MTDRQDRFYLHLCVLDRECRYYAGWVWRLHINTPWWHLGLALRPKDRFADRYPKARWVSFRFASGYPDRRRNR